MLGVCRGTLPCDSRRPSFANRPCGCCNSSTACAPYSGPCRPSSTRGHCDTRGSVLLKLGRPRLYHRQQTLRTVGTTTRKAVVALSFANSGKTELHHHQQALRLLYRRRWHCTLHHEAHFQFARQSTVAHVHTGPASPPDTVSSRS